MISERWCATGCSRQVDVSLQAYKNARDYDNLVRMLLNHLNMPEEAVAIVRESRSAEGAKLVAK